MNRTGWIVLAVLVAAAVWDIVLAVNSVKGDTISAVALESARHCSLIPWAVGVIVGHIFLSPIFDLPWRSWATWTVLAALTAAVIAGDIVLAPHGPVAVGVAAPLGGVVGMVVWPNRGKRGG